MLIVIINNLSGTRKQLCISIYIIYEGGKCLKNNYHIHCHYYSNVYATKCGY